LLYFLKIDLFFLPFIYSPVKRAKSKEQRAKSEKRKATRAMMMCKACELSKACELNICDLPSELIALIVDRLATARTQTATTILKRCVSMYGIMDTDATIIAFKSPCNARPCLSMEKRIRSSIIIVLSAL
jgi:hypothetical protein